MMTRDTLHLDDLFIALAGRAPRASCVPVSSVVIDSRQAKPGSVFVALTGEHTDGHLYVQDAFARGAISAIVERPPSNNGEQQPPSQSSHSLRREDPEREWEGGFSLVHIGSDRLELPDEITLPVCVCVENSLTALQAWAGYWRKQFNILVVGITGSVGKTTTKECAASVLAQRYRVLKSEGSYNNEIGLPLTLLGLNSSHECAVLEMGTYGPGEITQLTDLAQPQIGVVIQVGPVHLERMGTLDRITEAKSELPRALPVTGTAVLNGSDPRVRSMADKTAAQVFFYGLTPDCDLWADNVESRGLQGIRFALHTDSEDIEINVPMLGTHSVHTALAASAIGLVAGLSWNEIVAGLIRADQIRLQPVSAIRGAMLLDDTYNSSPDSAVAALDLLQQLQGHKIAVLGDMLELGTLEIEGHQRVGRRAAQVVASLITVGELGRLIGQEALKHGVPSGQVIHCADNQAVIELLEKELKTGDVVLVKGSRGMVMEHIVEALRAPSIKDDPESTN